MNLKKILYSAMTIGAVGAIAFAASNAFFSDEETSYDNTFVAGSIDLKLDNESYVDQGEGLVESPGTTWGNPDGVEGEVVGKFFDFIDLKPGDNGEDTISLHLSSNPAWVCVDLEMTTNADVDCTEPENEAEEACVPDDGVGLENGDLAKDLNFAFWWDDGDNVYEEGESLLTQGSAESVLGGVTWALADSLTNGGEPMQPTTLETGPHYIGKAWCYGSLEMSPLPQGDYPSGPMGDLGGGYNCDGSEVGNEGQTDMLTGDVTFRAVQARHNEGFVCSRPGGPQVEMRHVSLENKDQSWEIIPDDGIYGDIDYSHNDVTFHGEVTGAGLVPNGYYQITLNGPGVCTQTDTNLATYTTNLFESGYFNNYGQTNLSNTCSADLGQGVYNMTLIGDHYTFIAEADGTFSYPFDYDLPAGDYSGVKVLVKKMLDTHTSPWVDYSYEHISNLFEVAPISFTVVAP